VGCVPQGKRCWSSVGAQVVCIKDIFILNKIWVQDKIYIMVSNLLG
jgi:hypothetical protein